MPGYPYDPQDGIGLNRATGWRRKAPDRQWPLEAADGTAKLTMVATLDGREATSNVRAVSLDLQTGLCEPGRAESRASERAIATAVFLLSLLYFGLFRRYVSMEPDEGIVLQGAQRILTGEVPYRDFFSFLAPGSFYLLALLFHGFGSTMLVARTALAVCGAVCCSIHYLIARRVCARWSSLRMS